jgi:hypothetical protein
MNHKDIDARIDELEQEVARQRGKALMYKARWVFETAELKRQIAELKKPALDGSAKVKAKYETERKPLYAIFSRLPADLQEDFFNNKRGCVRRASDAMEQLSRGKYKARQCKHFLVTYMTEQPEEKPSPPTT